MTQLARKITLFSATFGSVLLLVFGIGTLAALFLPAIFELATPVSYQPQLPIAEARDDIFVDPNKLPAKQPFPALTSAGQATEGDWIRIPSIGVNVPLVLANSILDDDILEVLDRGAALYPNGIQPGRLGNTFISAHSTGDPWRGAYRFAFLRINELDPGNVIHLDYQGTRYTYKVTHTSIVEPTPDFTVRSNRPVPTMVLMACWPLWTTDKRMIKHAELTNVTQLTKPNQLALASL